MGLGPKKTHQKNEAEKKNRLKKKKAPLDQEYGGGGRKKLNIKKNLDFQ